jgi:hypothetical protein
MASSTALGLSNSPGVLKSENRSASRRAVAAGVDTWSVAWYVDSESAQRRALDALATEPSRRSKLLPESIRGHRVGLFPGVGLAFAEGHPDPERLCPPGQLPEALEQLTASLREVGIVLPRSPTRTPWPGRGRRPGFAGIRRLDLTADLHFDSGSEGLAVLAGVAAMPLPRMATALQRQAGGRAIETVYLKGPGGKRVLGRWYDKGIESGLAERGQLIRPEDQRRFEKSGRLPLEGLTPDLTRALFQRRFLPLWKATKGVTVATSPTLLIRLAELVDGGDLTGFQAEKLLGYLVAEEHQLGVSWLSTATAYRRKAHARELGLVLADGATEEVEVDLHGAIEAALEAEDWYVG